MRTRVNVDESDRMAMMVLVVDPRRFDWCCQVYHLMLVGETHLTVESRPGWLVRQAIEVLQCESEIVMLLG